MAICRFGEDSDLYVYFDVSGGICCCRCSFERGRDFKAQTEQEMLVHLAKHRDAGARVPADAFERLATSEQ